MPFCAEPSRPFKTHVARKTRASARPSACYVRAPRRPLREAAAWISDFDGFWNDSFHAVEDHLTTLSDKDTP